MNCSSESGKDKGIGLVARVDGLYDNERWVTAAVMPMECAPWSPRPLFPEEGWN